jgi:NAD(P)H-flavin reductase
VRRPATLLFGAREQRDLYALDEISAISQDWSAPFEYVPVLSAAAATTLAGPARHGRRPSRSTPRPTPTPTCAARPP